MLANFHTGYIVGYLSYWTHCWLTVILDTLLANFHTGYIVD